ncbi:MAG: anhydro-N-acetylmuramic acid kinase [Rhizobiaceae bacterium]|nr:anhydro-N-acetylmuramic acid kinase [Rhizobiaceae bacterium]
MRLTSAIGLMSGTSMDGIDIASIRTDGIDRIEFGPAAFVSYDPAFRRRLETALETAKSIEKREERPGNLAAMEREITQRHADAVNDFIRSHGEKPEVVGFHGQTVLHRPGDALTVQLGDGAQLARLVGAPVVYDMRANDMVHGGQGAPLVPAYHAALARSKAAEWHDRFPIAFVNIGGISNITFVPASGDPIAFDTGPGNALIDQWVAREGGVPFDDGGRIASEGEIDQAALARYLDNPFFKKSGPKSLDRLDFTLDALGDMDLSDGARTLARVSADAILKSVEHLPERPRLWVVCGGGRKNPAIVGDLVAGADAGGAKVIIAEDAGWNGDFTEAEAWAYLAVRATQGLPLTWPSTTGCTLPVSGGVIAQP